MKILFTKEEIWALMCKIDLEPDFDGLYDALALMFCGDSEKLEIVLDF
jgi:hypothetical protein